MRPKHLSRQSFRDMVSIIRDYCGAITIPDFHVVEDALNAGEVYASGYSYTPHEEGGSALSVIVSLADSQYGSRAYVVSVERNGRDCDGRTRDSNQFVVKPVQKRKRWYWEKDHSTGRPIGRFNLRTAWKSVKELDSSHRDYQAEAAGY